MLQALLLGLALAADVFVACLILRTTAKEFSWNLLRVPAVFGVYHTLLLLIGAFLFQAFASVVHVVDHWIAFILLGLIGIKMMLEGVHHEPRPIDLLATKTLLLVGLATSIDALVIGLTASALELSVVRDAFIIGLIVFLVGAGVLLIPMKIKNPHMARIVGGAILFLLGLKTLIEHLFV